MIQILGVKRLITLGVLLAVNAVLAAALYLVVIPGQDDAQSRSNALRAQIAGKRSEVSRMQTEYQEIQDEKNKFGDLEGAGFFNFQDRVRARAIIEEIQKQSHVLSAKYNINAVEVKDNPYAQKSDHVLLESPVSVKIDALDDVDVYNFIYWVENAFPGNALITNMTLERKIDIDENVLKQIGNGLPAVLMSASLDFSWNTFIPKDKSPLLQNAPGEPK